ncbi:MAG: hypothetical protein JWQ53_2611 [Klenkia sp.]|nr:hypothetical protein [Klenkia sp.]
MTPQLDHLRGRALPGATVRIEQYQSAILDRAVRAPAPAPGEEHLASPVWLAVASLRGMGISVEELCELAEKQTVDTLLFGGVTVAQVGELPVDTEYRTTAAITDVGSRTTRDGSVLDSVEVVVRLLGPDDTERGTITSTYLIKRGAR